jgi:hypothetical protein
MVLVTCTLAAVTWAWAEVACREEGEVWGRRNLELS